MTTLQDTIRIHHDTCILDASSEPRWIHTRYARDTQQIHQGYVAKLPEVFGEGKYGTSGVNSRGGKQNFRGELCAWKRKSKDGNHYRILEHTTGYIYQQGFPPSATEEPEEEDEEDKTGGGNGDQGEEEDEEEEEEQEEEEEPPPKKQKGGKGGGKGAQAKKAAKKPTQEVSQRASKRGRNK